jgi:hypothetical protein
VAVLSRRRPALSPRTPLSSYSTQISSSFLYRILPKSILSKHLPHAPLPSICTSEEAPLRPKPEGGQAPPEATQPSKSHRGGDALVTPHDPPCPHIAQRYPNYPTSPHMSHTLAQFHNPISNSQFPTKLPMSQLLPLSLGVLAQFCYTIIHCSHHTGPLSPISFTPIHLRGLNTQISPNLPSVGTTVTLGVHNIAHPFACPRESSSQPLCVRTLQGARNACPRECAQ